jgi:hypothetical protein
MNKMRSYKKVMVWIIVTQAWQKSFGGFPVFIEKEDLCCQFIHYFHMQAGTLVKITTSVS